MTASVRTEVDVGRGLQLKNPILTASGTFGYGLEFEPFLDLARLGGVVVKGISPAPRAGNPPARIVETPSGMLNAIGLQNVGVRRFIDEKLPLLRQRNVVVVVNVYGAAVEDYVVVAEALEPEEGVAALELNLSCPNVREGGVLIGKSPRAIEQVTAAVRQVTRRPLWVKLTPNVTDITEVAGAALAGGADCLCLINTFLGMVIDVEKRRPALFNGVGGLSGPAIRPLAVAMVHQVHQAFPEAPLIGIGGIVSARDVVEFLLAGASAVQIGTANFNDPGIAGRLVHDFTAWCAEHKVEDVKELIGGLRARE